MENIFVLLISEQTIPNVLFVKEMENQKIKPDKLIFITTNDMERREKSKYIMETLNISEDKVKKIILEDEYNILDIEKELEKEIERKENIKYILNFVGGIKNYVNSCI